MNSAWRPLASRALLFLIGSWIGAHVLGCSVSQQVLAGRADYRAYREFRLARAPIERLKHANRYLQDIPDGSYRREVIGWFAASEAHFFRAARDRPSLLRAYLAAMPDGPHSRAVTDRLREMEILREYRDREALREKEQIARVQRDLARASADRDRLVSSFAETVRLLSGVRSFREPKGELDTLLGARLRSTEPQVICDPSTCRETLQLPYAVPDARHLRQRTLVLVIELIFKGGMLTELRLEGPELFSRIAEAKSVRLVESSDRPMRISALASVKTWIEGLLDARLLGSKCQREGVFPTILIRECDGVRLELLAGWESNQSDRIVLRPDQRPNASRSVGP